MFNKLASELAGILDSTIEEEISKFKIIDQDGNVLKASEIISNDDEKTILKLTFDRKENTEEEICDDFDFDKMKQERQDYNIKYADELYREICKAIKVENAIGKNSLKYDVLNNASNFIATIKSRLEDKGFNVRVKDTSSLPPNFKGLITLYIAWN